MGIFVPTKVKATRTVSDVISDFTKEFEQIQAHQERIVASELELIEAAELRLNVAQEESSKASKAIEKFNSLFTEDVS